MMRAISAMSGESSGLIRLWLPITLMLGGTTSCALAVHPSTMPDITNCHYSDQVYYSNGSLMRNQAPTYFRLMPSRYAQIVQAARGKYCTGTATIAFNGHFYFQAAISDDPGLTELIPNISSLFGISLVDAFDFVVLSIVLAGLLLGCAGFWCMFPNTQIRWAGAAAFLCLGLAELAVADVYIFQVSPLIAGIPWIVHFALQRDALALPLSAALFAFSCSWCSLVRIGTLEICLAFLVTLFAVRWGTRRSLLPSLLILCACMPPVIFEHHLISRRDALLLTLGSRATAVNSHPVWHAIYTGLGFLPNTEVRAFSDNVASDKVRSIDSRVAYTSPQYEAILRREVFRLVVQKPLLVIENLTVKAGILLLSASIFLFPARLLLFAEPETLWLDTAFVSAIGFSAINAILVAPKISYTITFLSLTLLYSLIKVCRDRALKSNRIPARS